MMNRIMNSYIASMAVLAIVILGFGCNQSSNVQRATSNKVGTVESRDGTYGRSLIINTRFVQEAEFADTAVLKAREFDGYAVAGIVNHHSLAMDLQAGFFKSLASTRPNIKRFVVISPDHFLAGDLISTHGFFYATPAGEVESQALEVESVYNAKNVSVFQNEHGVGSLAPFIAREFPGAVMIPIYLRPEASENQLKKLGVSVAELVDERTFVILSSDMSHYLTDEQARENDRMTLSWIQSQEWEKLQSAGDDYTDSAQGFVVLEAMFEHLKQEVEFELLDYAVSTDYGADPNETTSYINGFYL